MSIRHYGSDFDDLDENTVRLLASRYCKVAMQGDRDDRHRLRRWHASDERPRSSKPRRPRPSRHDVYMEQ